MRVGRPLVVTAAIAGALGCRLPASSSSTPSSPVAVLPSEPEPRAPEPFTRQSVTPPEAPGPPQLWELPNARRANRGGALGEADGAVPDGTTVFDDHVPGVANLDPALLGALRRAATDAARDGVELYVESGWRSRNYQEQLLREAVSVYGSQEEAARWVATPNTSPHVTGDAIDVGPFDAAAWLSKYGVKYGLCQIYRNEPWHYELRPEATSQGCPPMYADPTHDPRMRQ